MAVGDMKSITYILQLDDEAAAANYYLEGTCSAFVSGMDVNDIPVTGEELVVVSSTDWNPWNDIDSADGKYITTAELQAAINCWLNDLPAPTTGADITTNRLQLLVHYWVQDRECPEGADA